MSAKIKVTPEKLKDLIDQAKRVKRLQAGRFIKGARSDGQPIYHYPKITLFLLAAKLDVSANYLTILKNKNTDIAKLLQNVGQLKTRPEDMAEEEPKEGTKAYKDLQIKRLREKVEKLEKNAEQNRMRNLALREAETALERLILTSEDLVGRNDEQKRLIVDLEAVIRGLRMENASLKTQLVLQKDS